MARFEVGDKVMTFSSLDGLIVGTVISCNAHNPSSYRIEISPNSYHVCWASCLEPYDTFKVAVHKAKRRIKNVESSK